MTVNEFANQIAKETEPRVLEVISMRPLAYRTLHQFFWDYEVFSEITFEGAGDVCVKKAFNDVFGVMTVEKKNSEQHALIVFVYETMTLYLFLRDISP